jgi:hypothetical protein
MATEEVMLSNKIGWLIPYEKHDNTEWSMAPHAIPDRMVITRRGMRIDNIDFAFVDSKCVTRYLDSESNPTVFIQVNNEIARIYRIEFSPPARLR